MTCCLCGSEDDLIEIKGIGDCLFCNYEEFICEDCCKEVGCAWLDICIKNKVENQ